MLFPISVTQPDWDYLKKAIADGLNINIDSGIINNRMKKDLGAFLCTLGLTNNPMTDMRRGACRTLKHVSVGFAMTVGVDNMKFMADSDIHTTIERLPDADYFIIATGTLNEWLVCAEEACRDYQDIDLRIMFNKIIIYFDNIGLKQVVNNFKKVSLEDSSFTLKRK